MCLPVPAWSRRTRGWNRPIRARRSSGRAWPDCWPPAGLLRASLLIDALTFLVSLASLAGIRRRYPAAPRTGRPAAWRVLRQELAEGIRYLAATRLLFTLLLFVLVLNLCLGADKLIIFLARNTLALPPGQVGLVVTAGGVGGLLGAAATSPLCRWFGPLPVVTLCSAASGIGLVVISAATSMPVALAGNLLYTWAIIAASVTLRSLRQVIVPRELLGRVTASWRLGGKAVTLAGALLAGATAAALGNDSRPVFAAAGSLTLLTVTVAWFTVLGKERLPAGVLAAGNPAVMVTRGQAWRNDHGSGPRRTTLKTALRVASGGREGRCRLPGARFRLGPSSPRGKRSPAAQATRSRTGG